MRKTSILSFPPCPCHPHEDGYPDRKIISGFPPELIPTCIGAGMAGRRIRDGFSQVSN